MSSRNFGQRRRGYDQIESTAIPLCRNPNPCLLNTNPLLCRSCQQTWAIVTGAHPCTEQQIPILAIANSSVSADIFGGHMDLQQSVQQLQPQFQHSQQTNVLHDPSATRLESSFMQLGPMHNGPPARQEQYGMSSQLALEPEPIPPHETTVHNPSTKEAIPNIDPRLMSSSDPEKLRSYQIPLSNSQSEQVGAPSVAQCPSPATGSYTGGGARPQGGIRTKKSTGPKILRRRITVEEMRRIKELRDRQGTSYSVIGKMFGRSKSTVHRIVHGNDTQALIPGPEDPGGDSRWEENNGHFSTVKRRCNTLRKRGLTIGLMK